MDSWAGLCCLCSLPVPFSLNIDEAAFERGHECLKYFIVIGIFISVISVFTYSCLFPNIYIFSFKNSFLNVFYPLPPNSGVQQGLGHLRVSAAPFLNLPIPEDVCIPHPALPLGTCSQYIPFSLTLFSCIRLFGICSYDRCKMQ